MNFKNRRALQLTLLGLTYSSFYCARLNLSQAHQRIAEFLHWGYSDYGFISSTALLMYAIAVLINGGIVDWLGGKKAILIGLLGSFVANLLFGLTYYLVDSTVKVGPLNFIYAGSTLVSTLAVIWSANYYFQSLGSLSVAKINSSWYQIKERGTASGTFGALIQVGRFLVATACPLLLLWLPWPYIFFVPAVLLLGMAIFVWKFVHNTPEDIGVQYFDEPLKHLPILQAIKKVITNPIILPLTIAAFCIGSARNGIEHWLARFFLSNYHQASDKLAKFPPYLLYSVLMPIAMIVASIFGGRLSDTTFDKKRFPVISISMAISSILLLVLSVCMSSPWVSAIILVAVMFTLQGANSMLMGCIPADFFGRSAVSSAVGVLDSAQYIGGAAISTLIAIVLDKYKVTGTEWHYWPLLLVMPCVVAFILSTLLWKQLPKNIKG